MKSNVHVSRGDIFTTKKGTLINTGSREYPYWSLLPGVFNRRFGVDKFISKKGKKDLYYQQGAIDRETNRRRDIITLIVKEYEGQRVDEKHLSDLLFDLRKFCEKEGIHHIVMPKICCGVHGCQWINVKSLLRAVFDGSEIHVTVKYLE